MAARNKIEFKIIHDERKRDVELTAMSYKAAEAFSKLLAASLAIVEHSTDENAVSIAIREGSLVVEAEGPVRQIDQIRAKFQSVVQKRSRDNRLVKEWRALQDLVKSNGLGYEFNFYNGRTKEPFTQVLAEAKQFRIKPTYEKIDPIVDFLEGNLIEVGGKLPNIHIVTRDTGNKITIKCTERSAKKANKFLYDNILISVWAKRSDQKTRFELCDSYTANDRAAYERFAQFFTEYRRLPIVKGLKLLHHECRYYLDSKRYGYYVKFLRLFVHDSTDINMLKTILIISRPFTAHERLHEILQSVQALFDKKMQEINSSNPF